MAGDKFRNAFSGCPAVRKVNHLTHHHQEAATAAPVTPVPSHPTNNPVPHVMDIKISTPKVEKKSSSKLQAPTRNNSSIEVDEKEGKKQGQHDVNDTFSEYIKRAKFKIRSITNVGGGGGGGGGKSMSRPVDNEQAAAKTKDDGVYRDKFSSYINRAKVKFRTTSSRVGFGKSITTKGE